MIMQSELKKRCFYDPIKGRFFYHTGGRGRRDNLEMGGLDAHGYGQVNIRGTVYKEHHLVWLYMTGEWPKHQIDHINHQRRDNRLENLRCVDNMENHLNRPMQKNNTSGFVGVALCKRTGRYEAYITSSGLRIRLGRFSLIQDAINRRMEANKEFGYHENHGVGYGVSKSDVQKWRAKIRRKQVKHEQTDIKILA